MPALALVQKASRSGRRLASALAPIAPLLTRVTVGYAFLLTGHGKLGNLGNFAGYLSDLGVPFATAQAPFLAGLEFVGGACLIVGLLTRVMGLGLLGTMVGALVTAEGRAFVDSWSPTGDVGPLDIDPWVFLLLLSWLVLFGPGPLSLDRLLSRFLKLDQVETK
jgi:putative oxidoreductase